MLRQGRFPLNLHAALEPVLVLLLIVGPFLFGFSDHAGPTAISIILGLGILVEAATTDWRWTLNPLISVQQHALIDAGVAVLLIIAPFVFGFTGTFAAIAFFLVVGIALLLGFLGTEWKPDGAAAAVGGRRGRRGRRA